MSVDDERTIVDLLDKRDIDPRFHVNQYTGKNDYRSIDFIHNIGLGRGKGDKIDYSIANNYETKNFDEAIIIYTNGIKNMMRKAY